MMMIVSCWGSWWWCSLDADGAHDDMMPDPDDQWWLLSGWALDDDRDRAFAWWCSPWWWSSPLGLVDAYGDDIYDIWWMMVNDDNVRWWLMMTAMMYDGWWIMMMMYDDDSHGCDLNDRLMMTLELWYVWSLCSMFVMILTWMIETLDPYSRGTWYVWATWVDVLARIVWIVLAWLVRALVDLLVDWRSTIFNSYSSSASIFISYSLH